MEAQAPVRSCAHHPGMGFVYICINCNEELVCIKCAVDTHKSHTFASLEDFVSRKKVELLQYIEKLCYTENPRLQQDINSTEEKVKKNGLISQEITVDIKDQAKKMKDEIDTFAEKLVKLCCEIEKRNEEMLNTYKSALETLRDQNNSKIQKIQETLNSGIDVEMIEQARATISESYPVLEELKTLKFVPGSVSVSQLGHLLGYLAVGAQDQNCPETGTKVVSQFTHKSSVSALQATQDHAWLSFWKSDYICRVNRRGKVKEKIKCKINVSNMAISPTTGKPWLCCIEDKTVREVISGSTIVIRFVTESEPASLCITMNDTLVVGMVRKIKMYTTRGRLVRSDGERGPCRQDAIWPWHMTYCTLTGDVAAADTDGVTDHDYKTGKGPCRQPHVKVMDRHLNLKFKFPCFDSSGSCAKENRSLTGTRQLFFPNDICFDNTGNILVTEAVTKSILLIDGDKGDNIRTIYTDGIEPWSLSLGTDGTVWLGLKGGKVKILRI